MLRVHDRYAPLVRGVLRRTLGPGHDVEDLLQEVFLGFHRNLGALRDPGALRPFLVGIAAPLHEQFVTRPATPAKWAPRRE